MNDTHITPHFEWREAACNDGTPVPIELRGNDYMLARMLERIRETFGGALIPLSWYRTVTWNKAMGGVPNSQHLFGKAADVRPASLADLSSLTLCVDMMIRRGELDDLGGYGRYPSFLHLDVRTRIPVGHIARWAGSKMGSEPA